MAATPLSFGSLGIGCKRPIKIYESYKSKNQWHAQSTRNKASFSEQSMCCFCFKLWSAWCGLYRTIQLNSLLLVNSTWRRTMVPTDLELWAHWYVFHLKEMPRKTGLFNRRNVVLSWNKTETEHKARPNSRESFYLALCCTQGRSYLYARTHVRTWKNVEGSKKRTKRNKTTEM